MGTWLTKNIELLERIGFGGSGEVWKAHHHVPGEAASTNVIAVKRIFGAATPEECERLFAEARVLEKLASPHIARFLFLGFSDACEPFLAMEFADGLTLDAHMKQFPAQRLPLESAKFLARQLAGTINYISSFEEERNGARRYLVHGDLKPRNLIVGKAGQLKLVDFGSARRVSPEVTNTLTGVERTLPYCAPEVDDGDSSRITEMFSLGAIYFEMLTGERAIGSGTLAEVVEARKKFYLRRHAAARAKRLVEAGVDAETVEIVTGLLSKHTRERVRNFQRLLGAGLAPVALAAEAKLEPVFPAPRARVGLGLWLGLGSLSAAAAAAVVFMVGQVQPVASVPAAAVMPAAVGELLGPPEPLLIAMEEPLVVRVDGERAKPIAKKRALAAPRAVAVAHAKALPSEVVHRKELPPVVAPAPAPAPAVVRVEEPPSEPVQIAHLEPIAPEAEEVRALEPPPERAAPPVAAPAPKPEPAPAPAEPVVVNQFPKSMSYENGLPAFPGN